MFKDCNDVQGFSIYCSRDAARTSVLDKGSGHPHQLFCFLLNPDGIFVSTVYLESTSDEGAGEGDGLRVHKRWFLPTVLEEDYPDALVACQYESACRLTHLV